MTRAWIFLCLLLPSSLLPVSADAVDVGANYDYVETQLPVCPEQEHSLAYLPNYPAHRTQVNTQLQSMRQNGLNVLRVFARWGNDHAAANAGSYTGALIDPPEITLPNTWLNNLQLFLEDTKFYHYKNTILVLNGVGAYSFECGRDITGLVIPTFKNALDQIAATVQASGATGVILELGNEIAPSNYESQCSIDAKTQIITAIWDYYAENYGTSNVTLGSILDDHSDFHIAGNRLNNLINAVGSVGRGYPDFFDVHAYGGHDSVIRMLRGVYQIYSDHGFLSNQVAPKETIIGETFYDDDDTAQGIHDYLQTYDGFNGGRIGLRGVLEWPLARPVGCAHAANVQPPYTADEYLQLFDTVFANGFE